jgi:hypothetical protein
MTELSIQDDDRTRPSLFEAREPGSSSAARFETAEPKSAGYTGVERRRRHRRVRADRREEMRFEPDKADRRANPGRRADDKNIRYW